MNRYVALLILILIPGILNAGGSDLRAKVISFEKENEFDYILELKPIVDPKREQTGEVWEGCDTFTIEGTYRELKEGHGGSIPTKTQHIEALSFLNSSPKEITFGYYGIGFIKKWYIFPCTVQSRALKFQEYKNEKGVFSWWNGT